ncbi:MAG: isochorismatase family cysteine hydrolase [Umezawaea sp.]
MEPQERILGMSLAPIAGSAVVGAVLRLRDAFDRAAAPVVIVRHLRGDGGDEVVESLEPGRGEHLVTKSGVDAFSGTRLVSALRDLGAKSVVIAGVSTKHGVGATAAKALALGFEVAVVSDATASATVEEHQATLWRLNEDGVVVTTVVELLTT